MQQETVKDQGILLWVLMAIVPLRKGISTSLARTLHILTNCTDSFSLLDRGPASVGLMKCRLF